MEATVDVLLGESVDLLWRGVLPPAAGYVMIDTPPGSVIRQLYRDMASESREHSTAGIARSLLHQEVMQVSQNRTGEDPTEAGSGSGFRAKCGYHRSHDRHNGRIGIGARTYEPRYAEI